MGPRPGQPGGAAPPGTAEPGRRLEELEKKLDAILREVENMRREMHREGVRDGRPVPPTPPVGPAPMGGGGGRGGFVPPPGGGLPPGQRNGDGTPPLTGTAPPATGR